MTIPPTRLILAVLGFALLCFTEANSSAKEGLAKVREIAAFETAKLSKPFYASQIKAYDLSADGGTLAVLLETHRGFDDSGKSIWLVLWDVSTLQIQRSTRLEPPDPETRSHAQYRFQIRLSPGTRRIFALTGSRLLSIDLESLETLYAFEAPAIPGKIMESRLIRHFSVSDDGSRLAVEYSHGWPQRPIEIEIADATDGRVLSTKRVPWLAHPVLSPDGRRMAFMQNPYDKRGFLQDGPNVFLQDVETQEIITELTTGVLNTNIQFVSADVLATLGGSFFSKDYSKDRIRFWDLSSGKIMQEFDYGKYGVRGAMAPSKNGQVLASVVHWSSKWNSRLDTDIFPSWTRLVLWDMQSGKRIWVSKNGPKGSAATSWEQVRVSADGTRLAVGPENSFGYHIWVYSIER